MTLTRELYSEFEEIVGKRNISEEPAVLETYRCISSQSSAHYGPYDMKTPKPMAVLLPGSTEQVQKIIQICNREKIDFKASSTFWSAQGFVSSDNSIQLDMRRMRKIEIDAKNMTATIEPFATAAAIQAETMKYGLTPNVGGMGCSSSILASTAGWQGPGPGSIYAGSAYDNLICAEWVLPNGEVMVTGSAGAGCGWFCGEGPGPSLRAIVRGGIGTAGDMGVCTKMSIKLSPWPGPEELPTYGTTPAYKAQLPDNFKAYTICFPDWNAWARAIQMLHESRIIYAGHRQFNMFGRDIKAAMVSILTDPEKQLCDLPALMEDPYIKEQNKLMCIDTQIILAGMSELDMEFKEKCLDYILEQTGGWKSELMNRKDIADWSLLYFTRLGHKNLNYVLCGAYEGHFGLSRTNYFLSASVVEEAAALKRENELSGDFLAAVGGNSCMGGVGGIGGGGGVSWEFFAHFDAHDKESIKGVCDYFSKTNKWMAEKGLGGCMGKLNDSSRTPDGYRRTQEEMNNMFSRSAQPDVFVYQWKVREAFNPNNLTGSYYKTVEPDAVDRSKVGTVGVFV